MIAIGYTAPNISRGLERVLFVLFGSPEKVTYNLVSLYGS